jgi:hypothetical protein
MSITHIASSTISSLATSGGTMVIPSSATSGYYAEVLITSRGHDNTIAVPTCTDNDTGGNTWTLEGSVNARKGHHYWKRLTSGSAGKTVTISGCTNSAAAGLDMFSGVTLSGNPISNWSTDLVEGVDAKQMSGFTPDYANSMIRMAVFNNTNDIAVTDMACTVPGSLEPEYFECRSTGGSDCAVISAGGLQSGQSDTGTFSWTQGNNQNRVLVWALRPDIPSSATTVAPPSSTSQSPIHTFGAAGTYTVTLQVTDALGRSGSTSGSVVVA